MPLVIAKTVLPDAQKFYLALGRIFGIGRAQGLAIAEEVGISKEARVSDVKANHVRQVGGFPCCSGAAATLHKHVFASFLSATTNNVSRMAQGLHASLVTSWFHLLLPVRLLLC